MRNIKIIVEKYNWIEQVKKNFFMPIGASAMWDDLDPDSWKKEKANLIESYKINLIKNDMENCGNSSSLTIYKELNLQSDVIQSYFKIHLQFGES